MQLGPSWASPMERDLFPFPCCWIKLGPNAAIRKQPTWGLMQPCGNEPQVGCSHAIALDPGPVWLYWSQQSCSIQLDGCISAAARLGSQPRSSSQLDLASLIRPAEEVKNCCISIVSQKLGQGDTLKTNCFRGVCAFIGNSLLHQMLWMVWQKGNILYRRERDKWSRPC